MQEEFNSKSKNWSRDWLSFGKYALYYAVLFGRFDEAREVLEMGGININEKDNAGETVMHLAAAWGNTGFMKELIERGGDFKAEGNGNDRGHQPIHSAANRNQVEAVRMLLELGVDVNVKGSNGGTPLHAAACGFGEDVIRFLVERGADISTKDEDGMTASDMAKKRGYKGVVLLLDALELQQMSAAEQQAMAVLKNVNVKTPKFGF